MAADGPGVNGDPPVEMLFNGALSLAGLVLVFLGVSLGAFGSFDPEQQTAVRGHYFVRSFLSLCCFLLSIAAAACAMIERIHDVGALFTIGVWLLAAALFLIVIAACMTMSEFKKL